MLVRRSAKLSILGLALVLIAGCSPIDSGKITSKQYQEAYTIPVSYCSIYNSKSQCVAYGTRYDHYPERFKFELTLEDQDGWVYVNKDTFDEYEVGDYYNMEGQR